MTPEYQRGWNSAHQDINEKNLWISMLDVKGTPDYIEGYHACQDNILEERANSRTNDSEP